MHVVNEAVDPSLFANPPSEAEVPFLDFFLAELALSPVRVRDRHLRIHQETLRVQPRNDNAPPLQAARARPRPTQQPAVG
jgi:hypothetical protein